MGPQHSGVAPNQLDSVHGPAAEDLAFPASFGLAFGFGLGSGLTSFLASASWRRFAFCISSGPSRSPSLMRSLIATFTAALLATCSTVIFASPRSVAI